MRIRCASFVQRILRPQNPRTENPRLMMAAGGHQKRLYVESHRAGNRAKYLTYHGISEVMAAPSRRLQSTSDCVVGADGLEPPTLSV